MCGRSPAPQPRPAAALPQRPRRVRVQPPQRLRHVQSAEAQAEVVTAVPEDRAGQDEDARLADEILRESVDRQVGDQTRKTDAAASRADPLEGPGPAFEEGVEDREIGCDYASA